MVLSSRHLALLVVFCQATVKLTAPLGFGQRTKAASGQPMTNQIYIGALLTFLCGWGAPLNSASAVEPGSREIRLTERYLNFPVKNGAPKKRVTVRLTEDVTREFEIELAEAGEDFWAFLDVSEFKGRTAVLKSSPESTKGLAAVECLPHIKGNENLYQERLRPQFHFSSRRGWNNDPNGMVFYMGEYHLYYQHNPYGWDWGNMHWGHAISKDLVHWTELPIALYPAKFGDWAFSGSAVVDWKNTSGFQSGKEPPLVLAYTSTGRGECIAYSNDRGRTWTDYSGNPVVKHVGRDPRLLWHEPSRQWVMALYNEHDKGQWITFHTSPDLKAWAFQSRIAGFYECPDLVELPVDGDKKNKKWVLSAASSEYMVGAFDGKVFTPETPKLRGHRGNAMYAAQTFSDIPKRDGRCIQIGWGRIPTPGMPFNQMMCFPTVMTLKGTKEGPRLAWMPVKEIKKLRGDTHRWRRLQPGTGIRTFEKVRGPLLEAHIEFLVDAESKVVLSLAGAEIEYDGAKRELASMGVRQPLEPRDGKVIFTALLDRTSLEIFADDGLLYMPLALKTMPPAGATTLRIEGPATSVKSLTIHELKSSWAANRR